MGISDAVGLTGDVQAKTIEIAQTFDKVGEAKAGFEAVNKVLDGVGKATGGIGLYSSFRSATYNPSVGNVIKVGFDGGILLAGAFAPHLYIAKPIFGIADGVWGVSGNKDAFFKAIDNKIDNYRSDKVIHSHHINTSHIKVK